MPIAGSARKSKRWGYGLCVAFGVVAGIFIGLGCAADKLIEWKGELTAGNVVEGAFNLMAALALGFIIDSLREKRNREQQLIEGWAAEALSILRDTQDAFDHGAPGAMADATFDAVKRGTKKLLETLALIENALESWDYDNEVRTHLNTIAIEANHQYAHAVGEKSRDVDHVKAARASYAKLRDGLVHLLPLVRH